MRVSSDHGLAPPPVLGRAIDIERGRPLSTAPGAAARLARIPDHPTQQFPGGFYDRLRQIVGLRRSDRHSCAYIYARCSEHSIRNLLASQRLRQLGHVVRMLPSRPPNVALFRAPHPHDPRAGGCGGGMLLWMTALPLEPTLAA